MHFIMTEYSYNPLQYIISFEEFVDEMYDLYKDYKLSDENNYPDNIIQHLNNTKELNSLRIKDIENKLMTKKDRDISLQDQKIIYKTNYNNVISSIKFIKKEKFIELFVDKIKKVIEDIEESNKKPWKGGYYRSPEDAFNALEGGFHKYVAFGINMITNYEENNYAFTEEFKMIENNNITII